jgi:hypothetical protein
MRPDQLERRLRERLEALAPALPAELLHVLMLPDFERAERIPRYKRYVRKKADSLPQFRASAAARPLFIG